MNIDNISEYKASFFEHIRAASYSASYIRLLNKDITEHINWLYSTKIYQTLSFLDIVVAEYEAFIGESGYRSAIKSRKILSVKRFYLFIKPKISGVEARLTSENISTLDCLESTNSKYSYVEHIRSQLPSVRYRFLVFCTMLIIVFLLIYQRLQPIKHDSLSESENTTPSLMLHFDKLHELTEVKTPNIPLILQLSITTDNGNLQVVQCTLPLIINSSQQTYIFDLKHCFPKGIGYKNYAIQEMNFSLLYKDLVIYTGRH